MPEELPTPAAHAPPFTVTPQDPTSKIGQARKNDDGRVQRQLQPLLGAFTYQSRVFFCRRGQGAVRTPWLRSCLL